MFQIAKAEETEMLEILTSATRLYRGIAQLAGMLAWTRPPAMLRVQVTLFALEAGMTVETLATVTITIAAHRLQVLNATPSRTAVNPPLHVQVVGSG